MIATGRPFSIWYGLKNAPSLSASFVRRKYVVSTPTTFPDRRRPSRVMVVFTTISALATSTPGTMRWMASTSR
jgi:hypothetical protein